MFRFAKEMKIQNIANGVELMSKVIFLSILTLWAWASNSEVEGINTSKKLTSSTIKKEKEQQDIAEFEAVYSKRRSSDFDKIESTFPIPIRPTKTRKSDDIFKTHSSVYQYEVIKRLMKR